MSFMVDRLDLSIGRKSLLHQVSLSVNPGEVLALLGPNGAGKSSLLKAMAGEFRFHQGKVNLNGKRYRNWSMREVACQVSVLPQQSQLMFPFSALEVVMLGRIPHSTGKIRDQEIAIAALQAVDAVHLSEAAFPLLSGGEKQRVQLARVLAQIWDDTGLGHRYLLLDEPTSALDIAHQHHALKLAQSLAHDGIGVLAVMHDLNLAAQYADRIVILSEGQIMAEGNVETMLSPELINAAFDLDVTVIPHPSADRPLVVNL